MAVAAVRRLPGFRFEAQPPPLDESLPRLDVAAFVGFAASGPLHTPVVVEAPAQFAEIFGTDATLAWDPAQGAPVTAHLAPAVRAFFRNGGVRAWVVRVAGPGAVVNLFPVPGLAHVDTAGNITPAFARARSAGSWSDPLEVAAALESLTVPIGGLALDRRTIDLDLSGPSSIVDGDLLRLTFNAGADVLLTTVRVLAGAGNSNGQGPATGVSRFALPRLAWFRASWNAGDAPALGTVRRFAHDATGQIVESNPVPASGPVDEHGKPAWGTTKESPLVLVLKGPASASPALGSYLIGSFGSHSLMFRVTAARVLTGDGTSGGTSIEVTGDGLWIAPGGPVPTPAPPPAAERLSFDLWVSQGGGDPQKLNGLTFAPEHPTFWGALPADEALYANADLAQAAEAASAQLYELLWESASQPRFPLAGDGPSDDWFVPLSMAIVPDAFLGPEPVGADSLTRDGLATFSASLFLDPRPGTPLLNVIEADVTTLQDEADFLRYDVPSPPAFTGIYAVLDIDEATIVAVPDAVHRPWTRTGVSPMPPPIDAPPLPSSPPGGRFVDCSLQVIPAPALSATASDSTGTFTLSWTVPAGAPPGLSYILEEATEPDYSDAITLTRSSAVQLTIYGRPPGDYYYRVHAQSGSVTSAYSHGVGVRVASDQAWQVAPVRDYTPDALLAVQRALLRMCAARGDLFAVLAMPRHDREDDAIAHAAALQSSATAAVLPGGLLVSPIGPAEVRALSFGALYHPWVIGQDDPTTASLRTMPPDGFACGIMALRSLTRGAWVAPANQAWTSAVDLTPTVARARWLDLLTAQVNLVRQEEHGFVTLAADTLSLDDDLRPINVRRLLILLRRLALRLGPTYVFEPNNAAFQRMVRRGFESVLETLFVRGAFAGDTRASSFQVSASASPDDVDAGRFIVEIRVAPSLPLTFMTIRLIQTGDVGVVAEGR